MKKITNIIIFILSISAAVVSIIMVYKGENGFEKALYYVILAAILFPIILYILDVYNIPTKLGLMDNLNFSKWTKFLTDYVSSIISVFVSSAFLIIITFMQVDVTNQQNIKLNNENLRIQNFPLLKYYFTRDLIDSDIFNDNHEVILCKNDDETGELNFTMEIENIGLNTVRKVYLEIKSDILNIDKNFELYNQSSIEKNQKIKKNIIIQGVSSGKYNLDIIVYYQDLLKNWYEQTLHLNISLSDINNPTSSEINSFYVEEENLLQNEPSFIKSSN